MRKTAFGGRRLGEAYETLAAMIDDPDCKVVLTLSGATTIAKMGKNHQHHDRSRNGAGHRVDRRAGGAWVERVGRQAALPA